MPGTPEHDDLSLALQRQRYSFICKGTSTRRQQSDLFFGSSRQAATCYFQYDYSKEEAIPLSALPKDTTSELAALSSPNLFKC